jgi:CheY-like chemotaxis protein
VGLQVTRAFDGEDAYQIILERGSPDAFDVILMDLHMPRKVTTCLLSG